MLLVVIVTSLLNLLIIALAIKTVIYNYLPSSTAESVVIEKKLIKPGLPRQLIIPSININATIDYVGLASDGAMDIKPNPMIVAWYMLGPRPGEEGSAVIAGHYGWTENGAPAIFNNIQKLNKGDKLSIIDQKGQSINFKVRGVRKYKPDSDATTVFHSNDGKSHLNLITCNGVWVNDKQSYSNRLVIFADKDSDYNYQIK